VESVRCGVLLRLLDVPVLLRFRCRSPRKSGFSPQSLLLEPSRLCISSHALNVHQHPCSIRRALMSVVFFFMSEALPSRIVGPDAVSVAPPNGCREIAFLPQKNKKARRTLVKTASDGTSTNSYRLPLATKHTERTLLSESHIQFCVSG
jgi:hypothetical protein